MRTFAIALARLANAGFFLATSIYCVLAYSPFAYQQFLKPAVISWVPDFLAVHTALFWLALLVTTLTLMRELRPDVQLTTVASAKMVSRTSSRAYVIALAAAGIWLTFRPVMPSIGNTPRSFVVALLALVPPVWLAIVDHASAPAPRLKASNDRDLLNTCAGAAVVVWLAYAAGAPFTLARTPGVELSWSALTIAAATSAVSHGFVFMAISLALCAITGAAAMTRRAAAVEYWLLAAASTVAVAAFVYGLVFTSIAFTGGDAMAAAGALAASIVVVWSAVARLRAAAAPDRDWTPMQLWLAPLTGDGSRAAAVVAMAMIPIAAYWVAHAIGGFDWNFLVQKSAVLAIWTAAFAAVHTALRPASAKSSGWLLAVPPCLALAIFQGVAVVHAQPAAADRYASIDMSFRFIRDLRVAHAGETASFYTFLKANTLVAPRQVTTPEMPRPAAQPRGSRPPHIFLFVIDSLRRDYVSAYNPAVTFTPAMARFASDSYVFDRALTRYAGTALAVPSIWSGGLLIHMLEQQPFDGRNALGALLDAEGYRRVMGVDHIMRELLPERPGLVELDRGVPPMECEFCRTLRELRGRLEESAADPRPVFTYTLPQNVHIAVASKREVPADHAYPGFFAPVAESVRQVDACFGEFIGYLQESGLYDDSIVIVTADHGDSLGEEGRWGHAYFMVPEVMRIPLIMHVPPRLRDRVHADLARVSFSTDITPTLYGLLGYDVPGGGPLSGSPLLVDRGRQLADRRYDGYLLASSYGAVYGMLRHNGRTLYTSDAMDGKDEAFELVGTTGRRTTATGSLTALNRTWMRDQLRQLAALNHFVPPL